MPKRLISMNEAADVKEDTTSNLRQVDGTQTFVNLCTKDLNQQRRKPTIQKTKLQYVKLKADMMQNVGTPTFTLQNK